jgi:sulfite reductase alpha subunit-like flavoprotein
VVAHGVAAVPRLLAAVADPDPDRRFCALLCLAEVVHPSAIPSLTALLTDPDYPTRMAAIEALRSYRNFPEFSAVWPPLRAAIRDPRASVDARRAAAHAAGELRDSGAVTALVATLTERDASLVAAARRALVVLTRQDFGLDVPRWVAWWDTAATRHRVEWLIDALTHSDATVRHEASEELKRLTGQVFGYYFNLPRKERERAQQSYLAWWHSDPERGERRGE